MIQYLNFTRDQAREYICRKLRIKPLKIQAQFGDFEVRKLSTLKRIQSLIKKDQIKGQYSNSNIKLHIIPTHAWLDIWVKDKFLTVRCYKK